MKKQKPGARSQEPECKGIVYSDRPLQNRIFIAVGMTGLIRSEWAMARYGQIIPCNWQQMDYVMWIDQFSPLGYMVADMRNLAVREFLAGSFEWLVFIDHDVILPPDFYIKLNERIIKENIPVWSGLYFTKSVPSEPLVYRGKGTGYYAGWKMGDQVWVNAVPMGCTVIHNSLLKVMWEESEQYALGPQITRRVFESPRKAWQDPVTRSWQTLSGTEDLHWCWRVIEEGVLAKAGWPEYQAKKYPFLCDTSIFCRHITPDGTMFPSRGEEQYFIAKKLSAKKRSAS